MEQRMMGYMKMPPLTMKSITRGSPGMVSSNAAHIIYKKIGKSRSIKVLAKNFFAKRVEIPEPGPGSNSLWV
jgi:hypothetical protein